MRLAPRRVVPPAPVHRPLLTPRTRIVLAVVLTAALGLGYAVLGTGLLGLQTVEVRGGSSASVTQVRTAMGIRGGFPLARVRLERAGAAVAAIRAVRSATVERRWPHTLLVTLHDRVAVAIVADGSGWSYLDATGTAFAPAPAAETTDPLGHPVVRTRRGDLGALRSAAAVVAALPDTLLLQVQRVDASSADSVHLVLRSGRTVVWGGPDHAVRKAQVATVLMRTVATGKTVDVSAPDAPTVQ